MNTKFPSCCAVLFVALAVGGCSSGGGSEEVCQDGQIQACTCTNGASGEQTCNDNAWGDCECAICQDGNSLVGTGVACSIEMDSGTDMFTTIIPGIFLESMATPA